MNKQFITKNFLLIVMLLAVAFAFAMKATVFQRGTTPPATTNSTLPASTTIVSGTATQPLTTSAVSLTTNPPKP
jgi:hypothetical protein